MTLATAPLSSGAFFTPSLFAFNNASKALADSTLKLSSGNRLSTAGDDVAAFSIASRLQSQLVTLKQASSNAAQGGSLLQVAQGGLEQILSILDTIDALAAQSNSASVSSSDRVYLQAEFAAYLEEIDRIAGSTSFNGIQLLNGDLSGANKPTTTTTAATKATATITLGDALSTGELVIINGVTFEADDDFAVGGGANATAENLRAALAASTDPAISGATYTRSGASIIITADSGGAFGNQFTIDLANSTANFTVPVGDTTQTANLYTLTGGTDDGLGGGSVTASGTIGDPLVNTQSQSKGSVTLNLSGLPIADETLNIDSGNGLLTFTFKASAATSTQITIGTTIEETLQNIVSTITQYTGTSDYVTRQLDFRINGNNLVISNKYAGNAEDFSGAVPDITETITNGSLSTATITGGTNTGINVNGVNNAEFIGSVSGFTATYVGADSITASITVGSSTYTADITDTTPTSGNSTVRFTSSDGGYFDVELADDQGYTVSNQTTADTYISHLNAAIEGLTFYQSRPVSNFDATGTFTGGSAKLQLSDFSDVSIDSISVTAPVGDDAIIDVTIDGVVFRANAGIGTTLGAYETLKFTSLEDANNVLTLTNGATEQDFSDATNAATFEADLRSAFRLNETGTGVDFQVGTEITNKVNVVVNNSTVDQLFNGSTPNISTQDNAADAQDLIETARTSVLTNIANVGALQARFQSAQDVNAKIVDGVTTVRSLLADTDIAEESTNYAAAVLRVNSGVAIIAQTRQLQSGLLQILQAGLN
ncbi:MAG: flagellin [Alphaproteobacteria bacterium]|nr:flagellin [Alphaproteobacteria bacterium]